MLHHKARKLQNYQRWVKDSETNLRKITLNKDEAMWTSVRIISTKDLNIYIFKIHKLSMTVNKDMWLPLKDAIWWLFGRSQVTILKTGK